jgi:hypothetical protein
VATIPLHWMSLDLRDALLKVLLSLSDCSLSCSILRNNVAPRTLPTPGASAILAFNSLPTSELDGIFDKPTSSR